MIRISLSKLYLNFMGFHRFHFQANRLPFLSTLPSWLPNLQERWFLLGGTSGGWMDTNTIGWMDGTSSGSILRSDLGNKRMYWFLLQELWNVCLFAFFPVPHVQMCHPCFFTFVKTRKMRKISFKCNSCDVFGVFFPHLGDAKIFSRPTLDLKTLIMFSMALRKPRFFL